MNIRTKLLVFFIPLPAIPIIVIGYLALSNSMSIFREAREVSANIEKLEDSSVRAVEKTTTVIESKTILDYKFFNHQLRNSLEEYVNNLKRVMETLAISSSLISYSISTGEEKERFAKSLSPLLSGIMENYGISRITVFDSAKRPVLEKTGNLEEEKTDPLLVHDSLPFDNHGNPPLAALPEKKIDGASPMVRLSIIRTGDGESFLTVFRPIDAGISEKPGSTPGIIGFVRMEIPLKTLIGAVFQQGTEFQGKVVVTDSDGVILSHPDTRRVGEVFDAFQPDLENFHVISHDMLEGKLQLHIIASRNRIRESSEVVRSLSGAIHEKAIQARHTSVAIERRIDDMIRQMVVITLAAFLITILVVVITARKISAPLARLSDAAIRIASGALDLEPVVEKNASTEMVLLAGNINDMRLNLKNQIENLDKLVRERTRELEKQLQFLQTMMDTIPNPVFFKHLDGPFLGCNIAFEEFIGKNREKVLGSDIEDLIRPEEAASNWLEKDRELLQSGNVQTYEDSLIDRAGQRRRVIIYKDIFRNIDDSMAGIVGVILDITELKRAEEQLVQSEKMAALGGLVAGVAHEINTPVGIGVTGASLLEEETREVGAAFRNGQLKRSDLESYLQTAEESSATILKNLTRASRLIQSFKQVAVDQSTEEKRKFNLNKYIGEILTSLQPRWKRTNHEIEVTCDEDLVLWSYPGAFMQIITNLVVNSLIHGFGGIEHGHIRMHFERKADEILFRYEDDGRGMDEEKLKRIFNPFFTTRRGKGGTGLGMNIVYNLVTRTLGGRITCSSSVGGGTRFLIKIPADIEKNHPEEHHESMLQEPDEGPAIISGG